MEIEYKKLKAVTEMLLKAIEERSGEVVSISYDAYWEVLDPYDIQNYPDKLGLGILEEDWEFLEDIIDDELPPVHVFLKNLARVFHAIGTQEQERPRKSKQE